MSDVSETGIGGTRDFETRDFGSTDGGTAQDAASRAGELARDMKHRAAEQVETRLADQKYRAVDTLGSVAQSLRTAGDQLPDQDGIGRYMAQAATQVDNLASFLSNREVADLFDEVEQFARRQPAAFVGGAFALGVLGARFIKSSRRGGYDSGGMYDHRGGRMEGDRMEYGAPGGRDAVSPPMAAGYAAPSDRIDWDRGEGRSTGTGSFESGRDTATDFSDAPRDSIGSPGSLGTPAQRAASGTSGFGDGPGTDRAGGMSTPNAPATDSESMRGRDARDDESTRDGSRSEPFGTP